MGCILSFRWWAIGWRFDEVASLLDKGEEAFRIRAGCRWHRNWQNACTTRIRFGPDIAGCFVV
jgi:hypothetical protein